jgi:hypothetical protein
MDIFFAGFAQNSVINIYSTLTTFSTCDSLLYFDDSTFSEMQWFSHLCLNWVTRVPHFLNLILWTNEWCHYRGCGMEAWREHISCFHSLLRFAIDCQDYFLIHYNVMYSLTGRWYCDSSFLLFRSAYPFLHNDVCSLQLVGESESEAASYRTENGNTRTGFGCRLRLYGRKRTDLHLSGNV